MLPKKTKSRISSPLVRAADSDPLGSVANFSVYWFRRLLFFCFSKIPCSAVDETLFKAYETSDYTGSDSVSLLREPTVVKVPASVFWDAHVNCTNATQTATEQFF